MYFDALRKLAEAAYDFAVATLVLAFVTAVLLDFLNKAFERYLLTWYQRWQVRLWIKGRVKELDRAVKDFRDEDEPTIEELVGELKSDPAGPLSRSGVSINMFGLPYGQLCSQVGVAAQAALDYPRDNAQLLAILVASADPMGFSAVALRGGKDDASAEVRERLTHLTERAVDDLQVRLGWASQLYGYLQGMVVSLALGLLLLQASDPATVGLMGGLVLVVVVSITAGLLAPMLRQFTRRLMGAH